MSLKNLKSKINEIEKLVIIRKLEMDQAYEISKEIEKLEIKKIDKLEELDENLSSLALRYRFFEKSYDIEKEIKLRNVT